jgi:hypothetical protein
VAHAQAARPLPAADRPGSLPHLLRGDPPQAGGEDPGLRGYRYGFDVAAAEGDSPYFCTFEGDFDDAAAMGAAFETSEGQAALADIRTTPRAVPSL